MDTETIRLLTGHVNAQESTVVVIVSEIAAALAEQQGLDLYALRASLRERADRQPETRACLEHLMDELERRLPHTSRGAMDG